MHDGAGCIYKDIASPKMPRRFRFSLLPPSLLLAVGFLCLSTQRGLSQISLNVPNLLSSSVPSPLDASVFQPQEAEEETTYPLAPIVSGTPPKRKSKDPAAP